MSSDFEQAKSRVCQSEGAYVTMRPLVSSWEQRKLGELCELNPTAVLPDSFEYVDLESVAGTDMISHRREEKLTAPSRAQRLASFGDIFYQTVRPYQKNNYFYELPDEDYVFSTGYAQLRPLCGGRFLFHPCNETNSSLAFWSTAQEQAIRQLTRMTLPLCF